MRSAILVLAVVLSLGCDESEPALGDDGGMFDSATDSEVDSGDEVDAGADADDTDADDTDSGSAMGSEGCGVAADITTGEWVERSTEVGGVTRVWFVWLPEGYDSERAYPVVYQWHGCSDRPERENNNVPVQRESGADAIHVRGRAVDRCWDTAPDGSDVAFFDALVDEVESTWCADPARRFATGYSSGAFMSHQLACVRGDALAGVASIAGGQPGRDCVGNTAALLIHDRGDGTVDINASERARDGHLERNGCGDTTTAEDPAPCERYEGCDPGLDVVWCETNGMGHARQDDLAAGAFWGFLSEL